MSTRWRNIQQCKHILKLFLLLFFPSMCFVSRQTGNIPGWLWPWQRRNCRLPGNSEDDCVSVVPVSRTVWLRCYKAYYSCQWKGLCLFLIILIIKKVVVFLKKKECNSPNLMSKQKSAFLYKRACNISDMYKKVL